MNKIIMTENLKVGYNKQVVIDNVDIQGLRGQLICLLGPNGVGKTTILRTITGLLTPVEGAVYIEDMDINHINKNELAKKMSVVLTEQVALNMMTVYELASVGRYAHTNFRGTLTQEDVEVVENALNAVKAFHLKDKYFSQLSDGEKQKVMIARALVQEPEVMVLDEPTSHLDIRHKVEVINILRDLCKKKKITVIMSLHDIDLATKGCQTILLMQKGKIVAQGTPEEIICAGTIQALYELEGATYSELLGSVEFHHISGEPEIFVLGGGGTGSEVYRAALREGLGICCGILHKNDVDYHIGEALGCTIFSEECFCPISDKTYFEALEQMKCVKYVIDTGFPVGNTNLRNLDLLIAAIDMGKPVFSRSNNPDMRFGALADSIIGVSSIKEIFERIRSLAK